MKKKNEKQTKENLEIIKDEENVLIEENVKENTITPNPKKKDNICGLLGFIYSFTIIFSVPGLILSIIGYKNADKYLIGRKKFSLLGMIISFIFISLSIIAIIIILSNRVKVIDFKKLSVDDAKDWCTKNSIKCEIIYDYSDEFEKDKCMKQDVAAGKTIKKGDRIFIYYSKGKQTICVTFMNGTEQFDKKCFESGEKVPKPETDPVKEGYTFKYWSNTNNQYESNAPFNFDKEVKYYTNLYANFEKIYVPPVTISDEYGYSNGYFYYIEGKLTNNDKYYKYISVKYNTYDSEGNVIGSCIDNQTNLSKNETWSFKAVCTADDDKVASYKYTGYNGR